MIHTRICDSLGIEHPIVLGGMGSATSPQLVSAVCNAGGFGTLGTSGMSASQLKSATNAIREATDKHFGVNHLLFRIDEGTSRRRSVSAIIANIVAEADEILRVKLSGMLR